MAPHQADRSELDNREKTVISFRQSDLISWRSGSSCTICGLTHSDVKCHALRGVHLRFDASQQNVMKNPAGHLVGKCRRAVNHKKAVRNRRHLAIASVAEDCSQHRHCRSDLYNHRMTGHSGNADQLGRDAKNSLRATERRQMSIPNVTATILVRSGARSVEFLRMSSKSFCIRLGRYDSGGLELTVVQKRRSNGFPERALQEKYNM